MYLVSISNTVKIYECDNWKHKFSFGNHEGFIRSIAWSDDGKYMLQVNAAGLVEVLCATEDGVRSLQHVPEEGSCCAAFHSGGHRQVAVGFKDGATFVWDTKFKNIVKRFPSAQSPVKLLDFNSKNTFLAATLENGETMIYGLTSNNHMGSVKVPHSRNVSCLSFHNEFRSLLGLATDEGSILLRDLGLGKDRMFLKDAHNSSVSGMVFSPVNKDVLISCSYDKKMHMHDTRLQTVVSTIQTECALTCVDMSIDNFVALGNKKGEMLIYDLRCFAKPLKVFQDHKSSVVRVAFQPLTAKNKKFVAMDVSLKETLTQKAPITKVLSPNKSSDLFGSYDIDNMKSPKIDITSPVREKPIFVNASQDSFLAVIGDNNSGNSRHLDSFLKDSPGILKRKLNNNSSSSKMKSSPVVTSSLKDYSNGNSGVLSQASTPITGKIIVHDNPSPSPIMTKNASGDADVNDNSSTPKHQNISKKFGDFVDSVETVKGPGCTPQELTSELKNFIQFAMFDVVQECKQNFLSITTEQIKNRLFLEDQLTMLTQKIHELQQSQKVILEENKKLLIEVEMLRISNK